MRKPETGQSDAFKKVEAEVAHWRRTRKKRTKIPEKLWSSVESLYPAMSVYEISKSLGLNYTAVKKRVEPQKKSTSAPRGFVEINGSFRGDVPKQKTIKVELGSGDGGRLSIECSEDEMPMIVKLAEVLWGRKTCCN